MNKECNECTTCVEGVCEIKESMIGVPCGNPELGFKCNLGRCMPRIQPATLIDRFIMDVGVQEADMVPQIFITFSSDSLMYCTVKQ